MEPESTSPLSTWIAGYHTAVAAIGQAVEELTRHCQRMPDPRNSEDVRALLNFRLQSFRLDDEPAARDRRERAAENAARFLEDGRRRIEGALASMLANIEQALSFIARDNQHGLFDPASIPPEAVRVIGSALQLVNRRALPGNHPLHDIPEDTRSPWLFLCLTSVGFRMDGQPAQVYPDWCTLSSVRRVAEEGRAESAKQARIEQERRERIHAEQEAQERQRRLQEWTPEMIRQQEESRQQRRIEQLENEIAALKSSPHQHNGELAHADS